MEDSTGLALRLCPDLDLKVLEDSLASVRALEVHQLWTQQVVLAQWILKQQVSPKGLLYVSKMEVVKVIGIAQAILWHKGHFELAGLISSINQSNDDEMSICGSDSRARITKEQVEELDRIYPYTRKPVGKQKAPKRTNPGVEAIESLACMFSENDWILTTPDYMTRKITNNTGVYYSVPSNIKILLATLAIQLGNRK